MPNSCYNSTNPKGYKYPSIFQNRKWVSTGDGCRVNNLNSMELSHLRNVKMWVETHKQEIYDDVMSKNISYGDDEYVNMLVRLSPTGFMQQLPLYKKLCSLIDKADNKNSPYGYCNDRIF
jgi:hypothetical protein